MRDLKKGKSSAPFPDIASIISYFSLPTSTDITVTLTGCIPLPPDDDNEDVDL